MLVTIADAMIMKRVCVGMALIIELVNIILVQSKKKTSVKMEGLRICQEK